MSKIVPARRGRNQKTRPISDFGIRIAEYPVDVLRYPRCAIRNWQRTWAKASRKSAQKSKILRPHCIDASVSLKWFFRDEEHVSAASDLLLAWSRGEVDVIVPPHWPLEVLNGIKSAVVKKRISTEVAGTFASEFLRLAISTTDVFDQLEDIYRCATELDRSVYDAAYIVLAESFGVVFVTGDRRLFNAVHARKHFVRYVSDFTPEAA